MELREEEEKQKEYRKNLKRKRKPEPEPEEMVQNLPLSEFFPACKVRRSGGWSRHDGNDGILGFWNFFQENLMAMNSWHIDLWAVTSYVDSIVIVLSAYLYKFVTWRLHFMGSAIFVLRDPKLQLNQHLVLLQNIMVDMVANTLGLRLPEELLLLVFQHLDPPTLLAVRQTCRFVGKSTSVEYFHLFLWNISILSQSLPLCQRYPIPLSELGTS